MKNLLAALLALAAACAAVPGRSQDVPDSETAQRARIAAERAQVEANFKTQEKSCYRKFAVNECLSAARALRREALADLRRQEVSLNDADRKRQGAQRQREIEERSATAGPPRPGQPATSSRSDQGAREAQAAKRAADRSDRESKLASQPDRAAQARQRIAQQEAQRKRMESDRGRAAAEAAQAAKRREEQRAEAQQHREAVERRLAEQKKPPADPLPQPAN